MKFMLYILLYNLPRLINCFSLDYSYTNQQKYSTFFLSNVNSNKLSYSNYFNSNKFISSNRLSVIPSSLSYSKCQHSNNNYLTNVLSLSSPLSKNLYYTSITTFAPTLKPSLMNTFKPTVLETPVMIFDTMLTFKNYDNVELDSKSQEAVVIATANSMNISASYVEYIGSTIARRRQLSIFRILGYNIFVTLKNTIPLTGKTDPDSLYAIITTNLINSVNSGLFISYLLTASNNLGITTFANSSITSVQNDAYVIQDPDKRYETKTRSHNYNTIYIIFSVLLTVYLVLYFAWLRRKYLNKTRQLIENTTNADDVGMSFVEEQILVDFTGKKIKLKIIN